MLERMKLHLLETEGKKATLGELVEEAVIDLASKIGVRARDHDVQRSRALGTMRRIEQRNRGGTGCHQKCVGQHQGLRASAYRQSAEPGESRGQR